MLPLWWQHDDTLGWPLLSLLWRHVICTCSIGDIYNDVEHGHCPQLSETPPPPCSQTPPDSCSLPPPLFSDLPGIYDSPWLHPRHRWVRAWTLSLAQYHVCYEQTRTTSAWTLGPHELKSTAQKKTTSVIIIAISQRIALSYSVLTSRVSFEPIELHVILIWWSLIPAFLTSPVIFYWSCTVQTLINTLWYLNFFCF